MAGEVTIAREGGVSSLNGEKNGGRNIPRLYSQADTEKYPRGQSLGISTRDASAEKDKTILESVLGQMSDGIWENSRQMEKFWRGMTFSQDERGNVEMRHAYSYNDPIDRWVRGQVLRIPN